MRFTTMSGMKRRRSEVALASVLLSLGVATGAAQQVTGTPGSPTATTTIDGRYLPAPPQKFDGKHGC